MHKIKDLPFAGDYPKHLNFKKNGLTKEDHHTFCIENPSMGINKSTYIQPTCRMGALLSHSFPEDRCFENPIREKYPTILRVV